MEILKNESIYRGRYRILRKLGEGGSSVVYMAVDQESGRPVAIKLFKEGKRAVEAGGDAGYSVGYPDFEADMLRRLKHPAIPALLEELEDGFVMEYIPGNSLEKVLKVRKSLREKEAVALGLEILDVFGYLHGNRAAGKGTKKARAEIGADGNKKTPVIYRDLKPANIMIKPDGHVALIDFGAARLYSKGAKEDTLNLGTCGFAAPEQYGSLGQTDVRTDIYCFGRTLFQMVGGKCSPELMQVIDKCTKPDREDRFKNCSEIGTALRRCGRKKLMHRALRNMKLAAAAALVALVVSLGFAHYDSVVSYAAGDAELRVPAVKERLGWAGIRIQELLKEKGIDIGFLDEFFPEETIEDGPEFYDRLHPLTGTGSLQVPDAR